jgi:hypothetical protein
MDSTMSSDDPICLVCYAHPTAIDRWKGFAFAPHNQQPTGNNQHQQPTGSNTNNQLEPTTTTTTTSYHIHTQKYTHTNSSHTTKISRQSLRLTNDVQLKRDFYILHIGRLSRRNNWQSFGKMRFSIINMNVTCGQNRCGKKNSFERLYGRKMS